MNSRGQAAIEYILLLLVVASVALAVYTNLRNLLLDDPNSFFNASLNNLQRTFNNDPSNLQRAYKNFSLPR